MCKYIQASQKGTCYKTIVVRQLYIEWDPDGQAAIFSFFFFVKPVATNMCPTSQGGIWQTITTDLVSISCQKGDAHFHRKCDLLKGTLCPQAQKYWVINYCAGTTKNVVTKATRCSRWKALLVIISFCPNPICFSYKNETKFCPTGVKKEIIKKSKSKMKTVEKSRIFRHGCR